MIVAVVFEGHLLGIHSSPSHAYRRLRRYPEGAKVVRLSDGAVLCERVDVEMCPKWESVPRTPCGTNMRVMREPSLLLTARPMGLAE